MACSTVHLEELRCCRLSEHHSGAKRVLRIICTECEELSYAVKVVSWRRDYSCGGTYSVWQGRGWVGRRGTSCSKHERRVSATAFGVHVCPAMKESCVYMRICLVSGAAPVGGEQEQDAGKVALSCRHKLIKLVRFAD